MRTRLRYDSKEASMMDAGSEEFNTTGEDSMAAVELQEQGYEARTDLKDQIQGVRLEVEKTRTEMVDRMGKSETRLVDRMGKSETRLVDRMGKLEVRVDGRMAEVETRMVDRMGKLETTLETRLSDQISGLQKSLRGWLLIGLSLVGTLIALLEVLG